MILQVKDYHSLIARKRHAESHHGIKSMFYFMKEDRAGYPTEERKTGWVVVSDTGAKWFKNLNLAVLNQ